VVLLLACDDGSTTPRSTISLDAIDGAVEPLLAPGQRFLIEGFGFGSDPGLVRFAAAGGGEAAATLVEWADRQITAVVADDAVSGDLTLVLPGGVRAASRVHVVPAAPFNPATFSWTSRTDLPVSPFGVALAVAEYFGIPDARPTIYAAGGAEPVGGDSLMAPDSGVHVTRADAEGAIGAWTRQRDDGDPERHRSLPVTRAFAAAAVATRYTSRVTGGVLYVIGGINAAGRAQSSVFAANVGPDSVIGRFVAIEPLPVAVWGAIALVRRGRVYVVGGADTVGRPQRRVFVGRIGTDGHIDGWYEQPKLPAPRALGGGVVLDRGMAVFGGVSDSVPPGGGLDAGPPRLVTSDTAPLSPLSGFFRGPWTGGPALLPEGRSQFATLLVGDHVLVVGGMYAGAATNSDETLAARLWADSVSGFVPAPGAAPIFLQGGGTIVGPAGVSWRGSDGRYHGLVVGGMDLVTRLRTARCWGF
jgi:hypothetical protein